MQEDGSIYGQYHVIERIAVGGMAEIFLSRRCGPGGFTKVVALKRALPELAKRREFREMFADEARLCASLSHPGLVQVFDYGEVDDVPYLAMEWVDGCDLAALLAAGGALAPEAACFVSQPSPVVAPNLRSSSPAFANLAVA